MNEFHHVSQRRGKYAYGNYFGRKLRYKTDPPHFLGISARFTTLKSVICMLRKKKHPVQLLKLLWLN